MISIVVTTLAHSCLLSYGESLPPADRDTGRESVYRHAPHVNIGSWENARTAYVSFVQCGIEGSSPLKDVQEHADLGDDSFLIGTRLWQQRICPGLIP